MTDRLSSCLVQIKYTTPHSKEIKDWYFEENEEKGAVFFANALRTIWPTAKILNIERNVDPSQKSLKEQPMDQFLEQLSRLPEEAQITREGSIDNETRKGNYIKIRSGLSYTLWFVGQDKTSNTLIVEDTGQ